MILFALSPPALKAFLISKKVSITFSFALKNRNEKLGGLRNVVEIIDENFTCICVAKRVGFAFNPPGSDHRLKLRYVVKKLIDEFWGNFEGCPRVREGVFEEVSQIIWD